MFNKSTYHVFEDNSKELVYLIFNGNGTLVERATRYFETVLDPKHQQ